LEPEMDSGIGCRFSILPALPPGLTLDVFKGVISGIPSEPSESKVYTIVAKNNSGKVETSLRFACTKLEDVSQSINEELAKRIELVSDIADLPEEPPKTLHLMDWMVWMVHRAYLNDPSLEVFDFNGLQMPLPHFEPRIAPKLMQSMATNTYITSLLLNGSNLHAQQGRQLAESLRVNNALRLLELESNRLDPEAIRSIAEALKQNEGNKLEGLKFANQKDMSASFGRPVEKAVAEMVEKNTRVTKLGFTAQDPHWRDVIDRAILRNGDIERRRRKGGASPMDDDVTAEEKPIGRLVLTKAPSEAVWEIFDDDDEKLKLVRSFISDPDKNHRLPTRDQLQSFAKSKGQPLPYREVAPLVKEFGKKLLDSAKMTQVIVFDTFGKEFKGTLCDWKESNHSWKFEIRPDERRRFDFTSSKDPVVEVSADFAAWLRDAS